MLDKLQSLEIRFKDIESRLGDPEVVGDMQLFKKLNKEYRDLEPIVEAFYEYRDVLSNLKEAKDILANEKDEDMRELAKEEVGPLEDRKEELEEEVKVLLLPKDPQDDRNSILEIRAGTGGDEASLFAGDLLKMYLRYCEGKGWKTEVLSVSEGTMGGYKEVSVQVTGEGVYGVLKYESGVHRVQRVPKTETQGRVHTSAATVAVLPEADEVDVEIRDADIRRDTFRASGAGGQHVNKTESAIRLTHIPTGVVAECQEGRSQHKNLEIAMRMLRTRIFEAAVKEQEDKIAAERKTLVSTGDRSAKIRTYNYPQGRVTDHRINLTLYNLAKAMDGEIEEIISSLQIAENAEKMKAGETL